MKNCPDCGNSVSAQAAACPSCGRPIKKSQSAVGIMAAMVIGIVIFLLSRDSIMKFLTGM